LRLVVDTNILISAVLMANTVPRRVLDRWTHGSVVLLTCDEQIDEFRRASMKPQLRPRLNKVAVGQLVNQLRKAAIMIDRLPAIDLSPDPFDNYLLALAQAGSADYLITGDKPGLLAFGSHGRTRIVTARDFLTAHPG
jgi:uncharacterized protein